MIQLFGSAVESKSIYGLQAKDLEGNTISFEQYRGKVLLIVNTASECGFTPQYLELEKLYQNFKDRGFEVLAFPSNDFAGQEPLEGVEIENFCKKEYHTTFKIFSRSHVKGPEQNEIFSFLSSKEKNGRINLSPVWNFQKYLVNKNGEVVDYFLPTTSPASGKVIRQIEKLLDEN